MLSSYTGVKPDLYKRYMDDVAGAASCSEEDLRQFLEFASSFHPSLDAANNMTLLTTSLRIEYLLSLPSTPVTLLSRK